MRRDSLVWTILIVSALLTGITSEFALLHQAFPGMAPAWDARVSLLSLLVGIFAGVMRMSPLPISAEGREKAIRENASRADNANAAAQYAARTADQAAKATEKAADAAVVAKDASADSADPL